MFALTVNMNPTSKSWPTPRKVGSHPHGIIVSLRVPFTLRRLEPSAPWQSSDEVFASEEVRQLFSALAQAAAPGVEPKRMGPMGPDCRRGYGFEMVTRNYDDVTAKGSAGIWFYGLHDPPGEFPEPTVVGDIYFSLVRRGNARQGGRPGLPGWAFLIMLAWMGLPALGIEKLNDAVLHWTPRLLMAVTIPLSVVGMLVSLVAVGKFIERRKPPLRPLAEAYMNATAPGVPAFREFADGIFRILRAARGVSVGNVTLETNLPYAARPTWLDGIDAELRPFGSRSLRKTG